MKHSLLLVALLAGIGCQSKATPAPAGAMPQARRAAPSSSSTRLGSSVESVTPATKRWARSGDENPATHVCSNSGAGCRRKVSSTSTPSVPRLPTMSLGTS
jgi:hypothetical protein